MPFRIQIIEDFADGSHIDRTVSFAELAELIASETALSSGGGTLEIDGYDVDIDLAHANVWTAQQTFPKVTLTQVANVASPAFTVTGAAHTALGAGVQVSDVSLDLARTVTFAAGALATQRAVVVTAPTYAFAGASTITNAATVAISGAPVVGTNATITNAFALWVQSGNVRFEGNLSFGTNPILTCTGTITFSSPVQMAGVVATGRLQCRNDTSSAAITIQPTGASNTTVECFQVLASGGSVSLMGIRRNGYVTTKLNAAPDSSILAAGECSYWFDAANGAAKFMLKGKTLDGTVVTGEVAMA